MTAQPKQLDFAIDTFVEQQESKSLLRFIACGSVDHGKSSLLGRLLYEAKLVLDDQLATLAADTRRHSASEDLDFSLLLDGLAAEREQKITIDIAYRFFATAKRKFIVIDAPGHEQYTRNMATGASDADLALILVNAQAGLTAQTRRHAHIVSMLGVRQVAVAINKMDLVDWSPAVFAEIERQFRALARHLDFDQIVFVPTSAKTGENVVTRSSRIDWYRGRSLLSHLETVEISRRRQQSFRMPVQWVNRPSDDFRGYSGLIASGEASVGMPVRLLPSGRMTTLARIVTGDGDVQRAVAGQAATLLLTDDADLSRGDLIADIAAPPLVSDRMRARLFWMDPEKLTPTRRLLLKLGSASAGATVGKHFRVIDVERDTDHAADAVGPNEIAHCEVALDRPLAIEPYAVNRELGGFVLIDPVTNDTVALGLVDQVEPTAFSRKPNTISRFATKILTRAVQLLGTGDSHTRSLAKALTWRAGGSVATFAIGYGFTGNTVVAGSMVATEAVLKMLFYYVHERFWSVIPLGKR